MRRTFTRFGCSFTSSPLDSSVVLHLPHSFRVWFFQFVVAPFEADAQLAYLAKSKYIDAIISEDSDLIPYLASAKVKLTVVLNYYEAKEFTVVLDNYEAK